MNNDDMLSSMSKKIWWSKLKSSFSSKYGNSRKKVGKEASLCGKLNVNEEYKEVFRTQSYMDIWSKAQIQLKGLPKTNKRRSSSSSPLPPPSPSPSSSTHSSPSPPFFMHLTELLLEPRQEAVIDIIKSSNLQTLLVDYFEASLEASNICESLLKGIHKTRSNHRIIKRVLNLSKQAEDDDRQQCHKLLLKELSSYASLSNPLLEIINGTVDFHTIHENYSHLLRKLTSRKRKIKRKEKFTRIYKRVAGYGFVITYTIFSIALLALAMHTMVGLIGVPGLLLPFSTGLMKRVVKGGGSLKTNFLKRLGSQLDVAARGVYTFINDFDTIGRLVTRLHDEVEHKRQVAKMCLRNGKNREVIREALKDVQMHEHGFEEQMDELEEHIYLCFLTINRSRRLVLQEILAPLN